MTKHRNPKQHRQNHLSLQNHAEKKSLKEKLSFLRWLDPFTYVDIFLLPKINPQKNKAITNIVYLISAFVFAFAFYKLFGLLLATPYPATIVLSGSMEPVFYRGDILIIQGSAPENLKAEEISLNVDSLENIPLFYYAQGYCQLTGNTSLIKCASIVDSVLAKNIELEALNTKEIRFSDGQVVPINTKGDIIVYYSNLQRREIVHRIVLKIKTKKGTYLLTKGDSGLNPFIDQEGGITDFAINANDIYGKVVFRIPVLGYVKLLLVDDPIQLIQGCYITNSCVLP